MKTLLAIDPSNRSCGWALFFGTKLQGSGTLTSELDFPHNAYQIHHQIEVVSNPRIVDTLIVELPTHYDSLKGRLSARRGDLLRLAFLCGMFAGTYPHCTQTLVTAPQWKGQLPKDVTMARLKAAGYKFVTNDEADAIALGLWALKLRI